MFKKFWLDVILGTLFIFAIMLGINNMTAFKIFDVFDPIGQALADVEMTDVVFSEFREEPVVDERIVLVNIAQRSRFEIGMMIDSISQYNPAVIGMDTFFKSPHYDDSIGDAVLAGALARVENLVMASKLEFSQGRIIDEDFDEIDSMGYSWTLFMPENVHTGFVNLDTEAEVQEDLKMCRQLPVKEKVNGEDEWAFSVKLASFLAPENAKKFVDRGNQVEIVNYRGNVFDWGATKFGNLFYALDDIDVLDSNYTPDIIEGKIVIFCFLGRYLGDREALEDKFFTPLNAKYAGRAFPDMFGGVIHANMAVSVLNEDYIDQISFSQGVMIAILICLLNVTLFSYIYKKIPKWYDGVTKLIQLIELLGLIFVMIWVLDKFSLKLDLTISLFVVALVGDTLEVYYGLVKNSLTRAGRKELFRVSKI
ncbi:MAG: CHASE2 domain-containing protein [Cytophagales bacterium]|nr:CHASE2 domain-containing protein [Cytophagales bacterium]